MAISLKKDGLSFYGKEAWRLGEGEDSVSWLVGDRSLLEGLTASPSCFAKNPQVSELNAQ